MRDYCLLDVDCLEDWLNFVLIVASIEFINRNISIIPTGKRMKKSFEAILEILAHSWMEDINIIFEPHHNWVY